jgi:NitT/TauT family transport system substrate-binding protein
MLLRRREFVTGAALLATCGRPARADVGDVKIARQPSLGHLPLMVMEEQQLFEKAAAARGLKGLKASYVTLAGGAAMNDALLSGAIQFVAGGVPPFILLWSKTQGSNRAVKGVGVMNSMPLKMNTINPNIKSLRDFTDADKIAMPAVKVSVHAMFLQMAAEKELGEAHRNDLDKLTVTLSHPDGMAAMFSGQVTAHFTAAPTQDLEIRRPGVHTVLDSYEILGSPSTFNVIWAISTFVEQNPQMYAAFNDALEQAVAFVDTDKKAAAEVYIRLAHDTSDMGLIMSILGDGRSRFTTTPESIQKYIDFMARTKSIKAGAASWKELFFDNVHGKQGS